MEHAGCAIEGSENPIPIASDEFRLAQFNMLWPYLVLQKIFGHGLIVKLNETDIELEPAEEAVKREDFVCTTCSRRHYIIQKHTTQKKQTKKDSETTQETTRTNQSNSDEKKRIRYTKANKTRKPTKRSQLKMGLPNQKNNTENTLELPLLLP